MRGTLRGLHDVGPLTAVKVSQAFRANKKNKPGRVPRILYLHVKQVAVICWARRGPNEESP